jgi:hypothetical protein
MLYFLKELQDRFPCQNIDLSVALNQLWYLNHGYGSGIRIPCLPRIKDPDPAFTKKIEFGYSGSHYTAFQR